MGTSKPQPQPPPPHRTLRADVGAPHTVGAVCNRCGRIQALAALTPDYVLYEQVRAARPDALAVPLVCVDRHACQRRQKARGLL